MMKTITCFALFTLGAYGAQAPIYMAPPATNYTPPATKKQSENQAMDKTSELAAMLDAQNSSKTKESGQSEVMIITPENRAKDFQAAIKFLNAHVPTTKPNIILKDGSKIQGIMDVDVMPGGTILIFKISSLKGVQYKVVNIEEVKSISE